jgi:hypothetical protein
MITCNFIIKISLEGTFSKRRQLKFYKTSLVLGLSAANGSALADDILTLTTGLKTSSAKAVPFTAETQKLSVLHGLRRKPEIMFTGLILRL